MSYFFNCIVLAGCVSAGVFFAGVWWYKRRPSSVATVTFVGPTIEEVRAITEIAALRVEVGTVMEMLLNPDGKPGRDLAKGAVLVNGDGVLSVNSSRIEVLRKDERTREVAIRLPQPTVLSARIDHARTKIYDLRSLTWFGGDEYKSILLDQAMLRAQQVIEQRVGTPERISQAKNQVESLLREFARKFGYSLEIEWANSESVPSRQAA